MLICLNSWKVNKIEVFQVAWTRLYYLLSFEELCRHSEWPHHISLLFTQSFRSGVLPPDWQTATVRPIFKKGDKLDASNYRPISLTSIVVKIMEFIIIPDQLINFLLDQNLIPWLPPREMDPFVSPLLSGRLDKRLIARILLMSSIWTF